MTANPYSIAAVTLLVREYDEAIAFFTDALGFELIEDEPLAGGVRFVEPPRREDYGMVAVFLDLYGNRWDLIEPRR